MPATPARIGFVMQEYRSAIASDAAVKTKWGAAARDTSAVKDPASQPADKIDAEAPIPTLFDNVADAQAVVNERLALLGAARRKYEVQLGELLDFSAGLDFRTTLPALGLIDPEKDANLSALLVSVDALDFETDKTTVQLWG